jgi:hypothetical protein
MKIATISLFGGCVVLGTTTDSLLGFLTLGVGLIVHALKLSRELGALTQQVENLASRLGRLETRLDRGPR